MRPARVLALFSCVLGALDVFLLAWAWLPAPSPEFARIAAGAAEWSARFGLVALVGLAFALFGFAGKQRVSAIVGIVLNLVALALCLPPYLAAREIAPLSVWEDLAGPPATEGVEVQTGVRFVGDGPDARLLDVYRPADHDTHPIAVVLHGGAWAFGTRSERPGWDRWLASHGYVVFDPDYRLAPAPNFRAAIADVKCAISFARAEAADFHADPSRLAVIGRSAGGHLALLAAYTAKNVQLPAACEGDTRVDAVAAYYPPVDLVWDYEHPGNTRVLDGPTLIRRFIGGTPADAFLNYRVASPTSYVTSSVPPTLVFQGGRDQTVLAEDADRLELRLATANAAHEIVRLPMAQHGFDFADGGWNDQATRQVLLRFLTRALAR